MIFIITHLKTMTEKVLNQKIPTSLIGLIIANILPILWVLFRDQSAGFILFLYWSESAIIGIFTVLKMKKAENLGDDITSNGKIPTKEESINFFCMHFGLFMVVHLVFLNEMVWPFGLNWSLVITFLGLFISHRFSYKEDFIGKHEYKKITVSKLFVSPYPRIIIIHTILFGGFFLATNPIFIIGIIIVKTIIDVSFYIKEHKKSPSNEWQNYPEIWTTTPIFQGTSKKSRWKTNWKKTIQSIFVIWIIITISTDMLSTNSHIRNHISNQMLNVMTSQRPEWRDDYFDTYANNIYTPHIPQTWTKNIIETSSQNTIQEIKNTVSNANSRYPWCDTNDITIGRYTISSCNVGTNQAGINEQSFWTPLSFRQAQTACAIGYHLPSRDEWEDLFIDYFNMATYNNKSRNTRESLFSTMEVFQRKLQLPMTSTFMEMPEGTYLTETKSGENFTRCMSFDSKEVDTFGQCSTDNRDKFAVRCFKD